MPQRTGIFFIAIKQLLGFKPKNIDIYQEAFTHRSTNTTSTQGHAQNYERMEFLGDAMLSAIIASHLYNEVPGGNEGLPNQNEKQGSEQRAP